MMSFDCPPPSVSSEPKHDLSGHFRAPTWGKSSNTFKRSLGITGAGASGTLPPSQKQRWLRTLRIAVHAADHIGERLDRAQMDCTRSPEHEPAPSFAFSSPGKYNNSSIVIDSLYNQQGNIKNTYS